MKTIYFTKEDSTLASQQKPLCIKVLSQNLFL